MKNKLFLLGLVFTLGYPAFGQFKSFQWADSVDGEWQGEKVRASIDTYVFFIGNYMYKTRCDFTYRWKCNPEVEFFEYRNHSFYPVKIEELFVDGGKEILRIGNIKLHQNLKTANGEPNDCLQEMQEDQPWGVIGLDFAQQGVTTTYYEDAYSYCGGFNFADTLLSWTRVKPMFKNPIESTPDFCTPAGPKVNVRSEESAKAEVLFQLDKGQFFEILATGKSDKVNGKSGSWYKISFEGKVGYIFSFYTLCKG